MNTRLTFFDYDYEPVPGLPAELPLGERVLWQGSPSWWSLARRALRVTPVACYFMLLAAWQALGAWSQQHSLAAVGHAVLLPLGLGTGAVGLLTLIAFFCAQATRYTITDQRLVIRHGMALPMSLNLPFAQIQTAAVKLHGDGSGNVALTLRKNQRVGYLLNWPHVRPGHYLQPQPSLRAVPDAQRVAQILGDALARHAQKATTRQTTTTGK